MAVYTRIDRSQLENLLEAYSIGKLQAYSEISSGIENTNYFLDSTSEEGHACRYVLTIFENRSTTELPFFNDLTEHLVKQGFRVPAPIRNNQGEAVFEVESKPGMIVQCLSGKDVVDPSVVQCESMAVFLANMHLALRDFPRRRSLERDGGWMQQQCELLQESDMPKADYELLTKSISDYVDCYSEKLLECPQGIVHGDLFKDNVLFVEGEVSGVIDFYHACQATLLFDLAVMVNDWAWDQALDDYNLDKKKQIVRAYQSIRPWTEQEQELWPKCLEVAALRFWISRLVSFYLPGYQQHSVEGDTAKNPDEMKTKLLRAQAL